jgi:lauroyl/myristoyl acyltransferase
MDIEALINHEYGIRSGLAVARLLPKSITYRLARFLAGRLAGLDEPMVRAVRSNQWVASGCKASPSELDQAVHKVFEYRANSIVELYHAMQVRERIVRGVEFDASAIRLLERMKERKEGIVVVGPHCGNYELVALAAGLWGARGIALTYPEQPGGYEYIDQIRRLYGIEALPTSLSSMKRAIQLLRDGGGVATGIDRPVPGGRHMPSFFGRPAALPVHYAVLAITANVPMALAYASRRSDGMQVVSASEPIPVKDFGDRRATIQANTEHMLALCEEVVLRDPYQWAMFFPIWPEAVPKGKDE